MGIRGELFSTRFSCDGRTYFFNVKQNRNGDVFLSIVESKPSEGESFDRRSIVIFGEHMDEFLKTFQSALKFIDKTGIKVDPDPTVHSYSAEEGGERRRSGDEGGERKRRSDDAGERHYKSDDSRPRRDNPREGRSSSFREHSSPDARQATRRTVSHTGAPTERSSGRPTTRSSGAPAERSFGRPTTRGSAAPAERGSGRPVTRASSLPATRGPADKPVKRIIVRKAKKPSSGD
ncbi:MAG TPA: DUF3276 family protein [Rectinemataceae bacterium]|nr:DUF3276 family protein [Rectinemataceae bacterium]